MKKVLTKLFIILLLTNNSFAKNLFKSNFTFVEFQSNDIDFEKNEKIDNLKKINLNIIFKNILTSQDYNKIKSNIDNKFADQFIRNIIIEDENIINNTYSANIKIDLSKKLIIQFLREKKYSYVDYFPKNFFLIILEEKGIENNLFTNNINVLINNKSDVIPISYSIKSLDKTIDEILTDLQFYLFNIPIDKVGLFIGKARKNIKILMDKYQCKINVNENGKCLVSNLTDSSTISNS